LIGSAVVDLEWISSVGSGLIEWNGMKLNSVWFGLVWFALLCFALV
jgi:hypothetical protein